MSAEAVTRRIRTSGRRVAAVSTPKTVEIDEVIHQPFFKAGIAVVLTLGAAWGAALLLRIALLKSFTAVGVQEVNAHGHAQISGWVGLFVMGFAYQMLPRFKRVSLASPRLALLSFGLMVAGTVIRSGLQPLVGLLPWTVVPAAAGSVLEIVAVIIFATVLRQTFRKSLVATQPWELYVAAALGWFLLQSVYDVAYFVATATAANPEALVKLVSTWQAPMREIQIHGFAMLMILGVSQKILPAFYGFRTVGRRASLALLGAVNVGLVGQCVGFVLMRTRGHVWAALWYPSVIVMAGAAALMALNLGIFAQAQNPDRSLKFIRTAYAWLFISLTLLVLLPAYQFGLLKAFAPESAAAHMGFSHAYYGSVRHAITVGFISLMIVGVASKVVPTLKGIDTRALPALWLPYVLLNTGCFLRVSMQTFTDFNGQAFPAAGVSGLLELTALAIWGVSLWKLMNRPQPTGVLADC